MSILDCLLEKYNFQSKLAKGATPKDGVVDPESLDKAKGLMADYKQRFGLGDSPEEDFQAAKYAFEQMQGEVTQRQKNLILNQNRIASATKDFDDAISRGISPKTIIKAFNYTEVGDNLWHGAVLPNTLSFESTAKGFLKKYTIMLDDVISNSGTTFRGLPRRDQENLITQAYEALMNGKEKPEGVPDWAMKSARSIDTMMKAQAGDLNLFGGNVKSEPGDLFRLFSNTDKVTHSGASVPESRTNFINFMKSLNVDWDRIKKIGPGIADTAEQQESLLSRLYDSISSRGLVRLSDHPNVPSSTPGFDSRIFKFKDADSFLKYQEKYGQGSLMGVLQEATERGAREVSTLKTYGPQPSAFVKGLEDHLTEILPAQARGLIKTLRNQMSSNIASDSGPDIAPWLRNGGTSARQVFIGSNIGSAPIAAAVHSFFGSTMVGMRGFDPIRAFAKAIDSKVEMFTPEEMSQFRGQAARFGWMATIQSQELRRVIDPAVNSAFMGTTKQLENFTVKASLLQRLIAADRNAASKSAALQLADWITNAKDIGEPNKNAFKLAGLNSSDLKIIKANGLSPIEHGGHNFNVVDLNKLWTSGDPKLIDLANRLSLIFDDYVGMMTPHENAIWRGALDRLGKSGALGNVTATALRPFTGYLSEFWLRILRPVLQAPGIDKVKWTAAMLAGSLVSGSLQEQLVRKASGKDFLPVGPQLLINGAMRSGLGPYASALMGGNAGFGSSFVENLIPLLSPYKNVKNDITDNLHRAMNGQPTHIAADTIKAAKQFVPGQSLWYLKLALQREVFDQLEGLADPNKASTYAQHAVNKEAQNKSGYWWAPMTTTPQHSPIKLQR